MLPREGLRARVSVQARASTVDGGRQTTFPVTLLSPAIGQQSVAFTVQPSSARAVAVRAPNLAPRGQCPHRGRVPSRSGRRSPFFLFGGARAARSRVLLRARSSPARRSGLFRSAPR
eukprot:6378894-Lingulodinium_polyedra.AAC.1